MTLIDQINRANARSRRVPSVLFKLLIAWFLSAIVLALLVPALHARGVEIRAWMFWTVILLSLALCLGPDVVRRRRTRH
jgi:hypothetical protein